MFTNKTGNWVVKVPLAHLEWSCRRIYWISQTVTGTWSRTCIWLSMTGVGTGTCSWTSSSLQMLACCWGFEKLFTLDSMSARFCSKWSTFHIQRFCTMNLGVLYWSPLLGYLLAFVPVCRQTGDISQWYFPVQGLIIMLLQEQRTVSWMWVVWRFHGIGCVKSEHSLKCMLILIFCVYSGKYRCWVHRSTIDGFHVPFYHGNWRALHHHAACWLVNIHITWPFALQLP